MKRTTGPASRARKAARCAGAATVAVAIAAIATFSTASAGTSHRAVRPQVLGLRIDRDPAAAVSDLSAAAPGEYAVEPPPENLTGPAAPVDPPAALTFGKVVPSGGTWAVVIGINNYPGSGHDLRAAVADADATDHALQQAGVPADHRLVLRNGQATASAITTATEWLVAHASKDATAVFFYAGHARYVSASTQVIVGADGRTVSDAALADHLRGLRARRTWITIAACYGGGFTELLAPGRVLTAAAPAGKVAYETSALNHSYLVEYMIQRGMIEGQGGATVQSAFSYAKAAIARDYPNRQPVEFESSADGLVLGPQAGVVRPATAQPSTATQKPAAQQPPATTTTTAPSAAPKSDTCASVTVGLVRCGV